MPLFKANVRVIGLAIGDVVELPYTDLTRGLAAKGFLEDVTPVDVEPTSPPERSPVRDLAAELEASLGAKLGFKPEPEPEPVEEDSDDSPEEDSDDSPEEDSDDSPEEDSDDEDLEDDDLSCPECGASYTRPGWLARHVEREHGDPDEEE